MSKELADVDERWLRHLRQKTRSTQVWACARCNERTVFTSTELLYDHAAHIHAKDIPIDEKERQLWRKKLEEESFEKSPPRETKKDNASRSADQPNPISKRPFNTPGSHPPVRSLSGLQALTLGTQQDNDTEMKDASTEAAQETHDPPRKRAALGGGISNGSGSPRRDASSSPPRRAKARPNSAYGTSSDPDSRHQSMLDPQRPRVENKQIWTEHDSPLARSSFKDASNIASIQAAKARSQALQPKTRTSFQSSPQTAAARAPPPQTLQYATESDLQRNTPSQSIKDESYDIILQPETRPISQEQLVAEVKGIYAGLVMVEAKCIEVDNKQATLAQADPGAQPKLNNEQWQALIALHRTLLHEHHDFFLASQHPSASPALRRLASKYAMPARMWRHGIHSFLELLRHRLPASLDHMLAFIYLAYSMMALLYETVPAFEDTWIECLGDLGRYRMAIEDDDIRDREVWTGVARHWYSKASDKAPTTGRLYHHLAILARPNALQQLFYYSKSLCVAIPFTSARESILTLFDPVLKADNGHGQRLPPLDTAFVKAHGLLFTDRDMEKFEPAVKEFLGLLDNQIGRVTRKFMEQGYYIAVANAVAVLGFATSENPVMQAISPADADTEMPDVATKTNTPAMKSFELALDMSMRTLNIVLQRIGDPNVLPFIHVTLVFLRHIAAHPRAMRLLETAFPWQAMALFLNTLLAPYKTPARIESSEFPTPVKDDVRPFTEDFAMRGVLWADNYYPERWFSNDKVDDEEKYLELASMADERKERILWLACRVAEMGPWIVYNRDSFTVGRVVIDPVSRSSTMYSATTVGRSETWQTMGNVEDEEEEDGPGKTLGDPRSIPGKPQD